MSKPALKLVNTDTGEIQDECPDCREWQRKYHGLLSELGRLKADKQAEAESDPLWPVAVRLFAYHNRVFGHPRAEWTPERFSLVRARLKPSDGLERCLRAISGRKNDQWAIDKGLTMFEDVFESVKKFERCLARCPKDWRAPRGAEEWLDP